MPQSSGRRTADFQSAYRGCSPRASQANTSLVTLPRFSKLDLMNKRVPVFVALVILAQLSGNARVAAAPAPKPAVLKRQHFPPLH